MQDGSELHVAGQRCQISFFPGFSMIFNGFPRIFRGFPWVFHGFSMDFREFSRISADFPWSFHGFLQIFHWFPLIFHGFSMDFRGFSRDFPGIPWISTDFLWISLDFPWILHWFSMGFGAMVMLSRVTIQWQLFYARHRITICGPWPNISYFLVAKSGHGPRSAQNCKSITRVSTRNCWFFGGSNFRFLNGLVGGWIVVCWMGGRMEWTNTCQTHSSIRSQPAGGARKHHLL